MSSRLISSTLTPGGRFFLVQLDEQVDRPIDLFAERGVAPRIGQDHSDLDRFGRNGTGHDRCERHRRTDDGATAQTTRAGRSHEAHESLLRS